jgi:thiol-disulfide isomerase/thioredoxin
MRGIKVVVVSFVLLLFPVGSRGQFLGAHTSDGFHDRSILHPPAGSKVAIIVFEDLGCPGCAAAHPLELKAAAEYHVPIVRYDYPIPEHVWTFDGAVCARYLQDKIDPKIANRYRSDVFSAQRVINSKDDLTQFTQRWMQQHGVAMPFLMDPGGRLASEVKADYKRGLRLNVTQTPTIVVVTQDNYQIVCGTKELQDPYKLVPVLKAALSHASEVPKHETNRR